MTIQAILHAFGASDQLHTVLFLITADIVFGVLAAAKTNTFQIAKLTNFLRDDVLGKVVPWAAFFAFAQVNSGDLLPGLYNFAQLSDTVFVGVLAALTGSLFTSLEDLGVNLPSPVHKVAGRKLALVYPVLDEGDALAVANTPKAA